MKTSNKLFLLLLVTTLLRCVLAVSIDFGNDEVYYTIYAQHLQWNYFDHPPMVALLMQLTSFGLLVKSELFFRLGPILLASANTFFIFLITKKIKNEASGYVAAVLFNTSIYASIIAGVFIMPDAPQLFFWMLSIYLLLFVVDSTETTKTKNKAILLFGLSVGLCTMSKVHGVFLWISYGIYVLLFDRKMLKNYNLYISILITYIVISPILFWNFQNNFITYTFHSERIVIKNTLNIDSFIRELFGGFLYNNPINYCVIVLTILAAIKNKIVIAKNYQRILMLLAFPLIFTLLFISLFRDTLPHWSGPAYTSLLILTACYLPDSKIVKWSNYAAYLLLTVVFTGIIFINFYPGTLGKKNLETLGKGDVTLDMYDWGFFKEDLQKIIKKNTLTGASTTKTIIVSKWFPGAHIDFYIAQPLHLQVYALGDLKDIHHYYWLNSYQKPLQKGSDAYYISLSSNFSDPNKKFGKSFQKIFPPNKLTQFRSGKAVRIMYVYLMKSYQCP